MVVAGLQLLALFDQCPVGIKRANVISVWKLYFVHPPPEGDSRGSGLPNSLVGDR